MELFKKFTLRSFICFIFCPAKEAKTKHTTTTCYPRYDFKIVIPMWLDVIAYYVIVKDSSSECLHVVMQRQSSALSLTARERLLLCWDMWEGWLRFSPSAFTGTRAKCVSLCVRAQQSKHGIDTHAFTRVHAFLHIKYVRAPHVWCLCLQCLSDVF